MTENIRKVSLLRAVKYAVSRGFLTDEQLSSFANLEKSLSESQINQFSIDWQVQPPEPSFAMIDPRGKEESGMIGPKIKAKMTKDDTYIMVNDKDEDAEFYNWKGELLWRIPALARGQGADNKWNNTGDDTPPGLYVLGKPYCDYEEDSSQRFTKDRQSYGWYSFPMVGLEGQVGPNSAPYRDGIMMHGGGTACGWPGAWQPKQELHSTLGCIRMHNEDLRDKVLPRFKMGKVYVGVFQEV